jgi:hypothetical protein
VLFVHTEQMIGGALFQMKYQDEIRKKSFFFRNWGKLIQFFDYE